jgi:hypothetical protein
LNRAERHYWRDLWRYRELFQVLAWRDISVRYKQTVIGVAWAIIRPFLTMIVFTIIFGKLARLPSDGTAPYSLMVFAGMLPWSFFATAVVDARAGPRFKPARGWYRFSSQVDGRENIFLNGAILGMTRAEIRKKFDEIVAFAEVERTVP